MGPHGARLLPVRRISLFVTIKPTTAISAREISKLSPRSALFWGDHLRHHPRVFGTAKVRRTPRFEDYPASGSRRQPRQGGLHPTRSLLQPDHHSIELGEHVVLLIAFRCQAALDVDRFLRQRSENRASGRMIRPASVKRRPASRQSFVVVGLCVPGSERLYGGSEIVARIVGMARLETLACWLGMPPRTSRDRHG